MSDRLRFLRLLAAAWCFVLLLLAAMVLLLAADLSAQERAQAVEIAQERVAHFVVVALLLLVPLAFVLRALFRRYISAPRRLAEDARVMLTANPAHRAPLRGSAETKRLAAGFNSFADAHAVLERDVEERVREANARIEQERKRLAALMSELAQSVIVCNVEGRILLYNARAMQLLRKPIEGEAAAGKAVTLVGLGRSVFAIFDRNLIIHALESIRDRMRQDTRSPVASFVTTAPAGQLVRVQMAPVMGSEATPVSGAEADAATEGALEGITGFVMLLDNITRRIETGSRRDSLLQTLTQGTRASLASVRAAVETIASFPEMDNEARNRFINIIGEEAQRMSAGLDQAASQFADSLRTEWPLEDMRGVDLISAARRRVEGRLGLPTKLEAVDESIWMKVDSYSLMQAITYIASRLQEEFGIREIRFGLEGAGQLAHLDLIWTGAPLGSETTMAWQTDSLELGGEACPLTLKQIIEQHSAEIWYQIHKPSQREYFRIAMPVTRPE